MESVCRTCMRIIDVNETMISINNTDLREKLQVCLPELPMDNVEDPKMCATCSAALSLSFRFKGMCTAAEKTINTCIETKTTNGTITKPLNDIELLTIGHRDIGDIVMGDSTNFIIAEEVEVESSVETESVYCEPDITQLGSLQMLSNLASQASKAISFQHYLPDNVNGPQLLINNPLYNWEDLIMPTCIEREPRQIEATLDCVVISTDSKRKPAEIQTSRSPGKVRSRRNSTPVETSKKSPAKVVVETTPNVDIFDKTTSALPQQSNQGRIIRKRGKSFKKVRKGPRTKFVHTTGEDDIIHAVTMVVEPIATPSKKQETTKPVTHSPNKGIKISDIKSSNVQVAKASPNVFVMPVAKTSHSIEAKASSAVTNPVVKLPNMPLNAVKNTFVKSQNTVEKNVPKLPVEKSPYTSPKMPNVIEVKRRHKMTPRELFSKMETERLSKSCNGFVTTSPTKTPATVPIVTPPKASSTPQNKQNGIPVKNPTNIKTIAQCEEKPLNKVRKTRGHYKPSTNVTLYSELKEIFAQSQKPTKPQKISKPEIKHNNVNTAQVTRKDIDETKVKDSKNIDGTKAEVQNGTNITYLNRNIVIRVLKGTPPVENNTSNTQLDKISHVKKINAHTKENVAHENVEIKGSQSKHKSTLHKNDGKTETKLLGATSSKHHKIPQSKGPSINKTKYDNKSELDDSDNEQDVDIRDELIESPKPTHQNNMANSRRIIDKAKKYNKNVDENGKVQMQHVSLTPQTKNRTNRTKLNNAESEVETSPKLPPKLRHKTVTNDHGKTLIPTNNGTMSDSTDAESSDTDVDALPELPKRSQCGRKILLTPKMKHYNATISHKVTESELSDEEVPSPKHQKVPLKKQISTTNNPKPKTKLNAVTQPVEVPHRVSMQHHTNKNTLPTTNLNNNKRKLKKLPGEEVSPKTPEPPKPKRQKHTLANNDTVTDEVPSAKHISTITKNSPNLHNVQTKLLSETLQTKPKKVTSDETLAIIKLLQTPECQNLLKMQAKSLKGNNSTVALNLLQLQASLTKDLNVDETESHDDEQATPSLNNSTSTQSTPKSNKSSGEEQQPSPEKPKRKRRKYVSFALARKLRKQRYIQDKLEGKVLHVRKEIDGRTLRPKPIARPCETCGKIYTSVSGLEIHKRSHVILKSFSCDLCGKTFTLQHYLSIHTKKHFSAGEHQCETCEKYFSSSFILKKHMFTHTGEKPFKCILCDRGFSQRGNLEIHMGIHTGRKDFVCYICNSAFSQKGHLADHILIHTGKRPHSCDLCPKTYKKSTLLRAHKSLHTLKPFRCNDCNTLFRSEQNLMHHRKKYQKYLPGKCAGRIYNCGICNKYFNNNYSRDRHLKVHVKDLI